MDDDDDDDDDADDDSDGVDDDVDDAVEDDNEAEAVPRDDDEAGKGFGLVAGLRLRLSLDDIDTNTILMLNEQTKMLDEAKNNEMKCHETIAAGFGFAEFCRGCHSHPTRPWERES